MNEEADNEKRLSQTLRQWTVTTPLPPRFEQQVWRRIERAQTQPEAGILEFVVGFVQNVLLRPKFAYAYAALLLALGVAAGSLAAHSETNRLSAALGSRYIQSIDPYYAAAPHR
jgi:hypothetical protein